MYVLLAVCGQTLLLTFLLLTPPTAAADNTRPGRSDARPFWTEQSSFIFGEDLYTIGVSTSARSAEVARQAAFEHGLEEIRNYSQTDSLAGLQVETQMLYTESQADGTVSVWRLLRVDLRRLQAMAKGNRKEGHHAPVVVHYPPTGVQKPVIMQTAAQVPKVDKHLPAAPTLPLQSIPQRSSVTVEGWTRDEHGRLAVGIDDRRPWQIRTLSAADLTYRK